MQSDLTTHFPMRNARVHEACGAAALGFAVVFASLRQGHVLLIRESWRADVVNPMGAAPFFDPARLLVAFVKDQTEGLAVMEEALRDGAVGTVIAELNKPLDLTAGRRLQLAAKTGNTTGLCLISEDMGSNAAETRWKCDPVFDPNGSDSTLMRWSLIKNKSGTLCSWYVRWNPYKSDPAHRVVVVSTPVN
ncbi:ImuA family protein [Loktanella sp. S4079]|uniref:ImuA family protein n=1 Tax=Loktanella sp. S4079 TaxID=579483 RepID=UPI0005F9D196|nr:hypothetical protein [Loktanella sp. S4079]KJZ17550.1 hypothetical protein TW80_16935 [Loktanella sp. S4079]